MDIKLQEILETSTASGFVLVGFSGAGKSTLSKEISLFFQNEIECFDLDDLIFEKVKISSDQGLGEYINRVGFTEFRKVEFETLKNFVQKTESRFVLALGGGAFTLEAIDFLKKESQILTIFIDVDFEVCYERIKNDPNRPLSQKPKAELKELYITRQKNYLLADKIIRL